ncbi:MAG: type II toxin-antitoxin system RelE/ParE family toxin [Bacteroidales bacterium]|nr:type II toxin-antitoxin system RelE/ParE family toxin [Bacteroidales bacterium]
MAKITFREKAIEDLDRIWIYTFENWSESQADAYYFFIVDECRYISENSNLGKSYPTIRKGILGHKAAKHIMFFQKTDDSEIEVIRILHESMDLKSRLNTD